jgi:hypothetical protein
MMPDRADACVRQKALRYARAMSARLRLLGEPKTFAAVCAVLAALATAQPALAEEPLAPQVDTNPSHYPPPSARTNTFLIGAALTVGWYGAAVGDSYLWQDSRGSAALRIPVAGPFVALGKTGCHGSRECDLFPAIVRTTLTVLSAVGQVGGVGAMLEGIFVPVSAVSASRAAAAPPLETAKPHVAFAPAPVGASGLGLGVLGSF